MGSASTVAPPPLDFQAHKIAIVSARFNASVTSALHKSALHTLIAAGCPQANISQLWVPGAYELGWAVANLLKAKKEVTGIITLGAVIRGDTPHFEYVASAVAHAIAQLAIGSSAPIIFGVLTVDNMQQALARSGAQDNKGREATISLIECLRLKQQFGV